MRRLLVGFLATIGFLLLLTVAGIGGLVWWGGGLFGGGKTMPQSIVLELDLRTALAEAPPRSGIAGLGLDGSMTVSEVVLALDRAQRDPRVKGLLALVDDQRQGLAIAQELRDAVLRFGKSGKSTTAWADSFGELTSGLEPYYVATAFDQIALQPVGLVGLSGISAETPYFRGLLDKLGVQPAVRQREEYKSAFESFAAKEPSPASRAMTEAILDQVWEGLASAVALARGMPDEVARRLLGSGPWTGEGAVELKLIDRLVYLDEVRAEADRGAKRVDLADYAQASAGPSSGPVVALVQAEGAIARGDSEVASGIAGETLARLLARQVADDEVAAILLRIDSPGGSPVASEAVARELRRAKAARKPVIVSMGNVAASGGYWIAMDADRIVAQPLTLTGSIGVIAGKPVVAGALGMLGVEVWQAGRGENAGMWALSKDFEGSASARVDTLLDEIYDRFKDGVARGRKLERARVDEIARGRVWTGAAALPLGLVDRNGGLIEALAEVRAALGLEEEASLQVRLLPEPPDPLDLVQQLWSDGGQITAFGRGLSALLAPAGITTAVVPVIR